MDLLEILSWIAIVILSISYWFQIWKIHVHREVRDLSIMYNVLLAVGFTILGFTAWKEHSVIFLTKQIVTTVPVFIIIAQILYHRQDRWHNSNANYCPNCNEELERKWKHCAFCGQDTKK